jgi:ribokinase
MNPRVVVVGAHAPGVLMRVSRIPAAGETVLAKDYSEPLDGGKGSNQAIAAARLGESVAFVGRVGMDSRGEQAAELLRDNGVDIRYLLRSDSQPTGTGINLLDDDGIPAMVTVPGANAELSADDVDRALAGLSAAMILLVQLEIPVDVALHALRVGKALGMLTVLNAAPASIDVDRLLPGDIDILIVNEVEGETLVSRREPQDDDHSTRLAEDLRVRTGIESVVVTLGGHGLVGCDSAGQWYTPPCPVRAIDTSGAGDVFCAALATRLVARHDLRNACAWAGAAAAVSVANPGTIAGFPTGDEVERLLSDCQREPDQVALGPC